MRHVEGLHWTATMTDGTERQFGIARSLLLDKRGRQYALPPLVTPSRDGKKLLIDSGQRGTRCASSDRINQYMPHAVNASALFCGDERLLYNDDYFPVGDLIRTKALLYVRKDYRPWVRIGCQELFETYEARHASDDNDGLDTLHWLGDYNRFREVHYWSPQDDEIS